MTSKEHSRGRNCFLCGEKPPTTLHLFPKDPELILLWKKACNLADYDNVTGIYICSNHFKITDYREPNAKKIGGTLRLKPGVFPSVSVPNEIENTEHLVISSTWTQKEKVEFEYINLSEQTVINSPEATINNSSKETDINPLIETVINLPEETISNSSKETDVNLFKETDINLFKETVINSSEETVSNSLKETVINSSEEAVSNLLTETDINPLKETVINPPQETVSNLLTETVINLSNEETEPSDILPCSNQSEFGQLDFPKKRRCFYPRYVSEITSLDLATPKKAKIAITLAKQQIDKQHKKIKALEQENRRLRKKMESLQELVHHVLCEDSEDTVQVVESNTIKN